jgi:ubiquinone/menaquinone biosynthesis C-methylase UbiE
MPVLYSRFWKAFNDKSIGNRGNQEKRKLRDGVSVSSVASVRGSAADCEGGEDDTEEILNGGKIMNQISDLLICPKTKQLLKIDLQKEIAVSNDEKVKYPLIDGIIDFCSEDNVTKHIAQSYDIVSSSYDNLLTSATLFTRLYNKAVWGLSDKDYAERLLSSFPISNNGVILDVPVGTGVFTVDLYKKIAASSQIIVLDYSMGMLRKAKERYEKSGIHNIIYIHGDIGELPLLEDSVDVLLTMNGYHAFPEKEKALHETARVMKPGSSLLGCFYIKDQRRLTDFVVNHVYQRLGSFTPPFFGLEEIEEQWGKYFEFRQYSNVKSIVYFSGIRKNS